MSNNPIPSNSIEDLQRNIRIEDVVVSSRDKEHTPNRFGVDVLTLFGMEKKHDRLMAWQESNFSNFMIASGGAFSDFMRSSESTFSSFMDGSEQDFENLLSQSEQDFQAFLASSGFMDMGDYRPGLVINYHNQGFTRCDPDGACLFYTVRGDVSLPYTLTGDWASESDKFVARGDDTLRQDLRSENGPKIIGYRAEGDGAILQTLQDKLTTLAVNAFDYGLLPNSTGPASSVAAQKAHDYVESKGGGTVFLPPGDFYLQDVIFKPSVRWVGAGWNATRIRIRPNPSAGASIFRVYDSVVGDMAGISFEHMSIIGDGTFEKYRPNMDATANGIDFGSNAADAWIQQCSFKDLFFTRCNRGLNLFNHVRFAPVTNSRFWYNNEGLHVENEHPYINGLDVRYNDIGLTGTIQDMEAIGMRLVSNRVGSDARISRSRLIGCAAWQNIEYGIRNILEYNSIIGIQVRGAADFWANLHGIPNESVGLEIFSRGTSVVASNFWGGNGKAFIELASTGVQSGLRIANNNAVLNSGHFLEKVGSGAYTHVALINNHFEVLSVGDGEGAMVVRVRDGLGGSFNNMMFCMNAIRNSGTSQLHDFVDVRGTGSGHTLVGNNHHVTGGVSKGYYLQNTANTTITGNGFTFGVGGSYSTKFTFGSIQGGLTVKDNPGFVTENSGTASFQAGVDYLDVEHGLAIKPLANSIILTPNSNLKAAGVDSFWVDWANLTDTHIRIRLSSPPSVSVAIAWNVSAARFI